MFRIGQAQTRFEDEVLVRGEGCYTDDHRKVSALSMVLLRSPVAAGDISQLDVSEARMAPGVVAVLTAADLAREGIRSFSSRAHHPGPDGGSMRAPAFLPLAGSAVRHMGDPVAAVIAETPSQAQDAAELIVLDIEERTPVTDALAASEEGAPLVWPEFGDNHCFRVDKGDAEAVARALGEAAHIIRHRFRITRVTAAALEPRNALATFDPEAGTYRLEVGTQTPHRIAADLAPVLGVDKCAIRVVSPHCGGSFGMKNAGYPEYALALLAARVTGRPVRWAASRLESFQSDAHGRDQWADAALALDADGTLLALDVHVRANLGAYLGPATVHPPVGNVGGLAGVYRLPAIHVRVDGYFTNTQQTAPYRGAGRPEATYVIEQMMDLAARALGMDRAELRRRNFIPPEQMPYATALTYTYDSGNFPGLLDKALTMADWAGFGARRAESEARGRLRGLGIAYPIEIAGGPATTPNGEFARLELAADGRLRILAGSSDSGQGHLTAFRQIVSDRLGLDPADIDLVTGDTDLVPEGTGTFGSRTMSAAGTSIWRAAETMVERLKGRAAAHLEAPGGDVSFDAGIYRAIGTNKSVRLRELLGDLEETVSTESTEPAKGATFPNGCHICEVEIEPETGRVEVVRYVVVDDVGIVINPLLVEGQLTGGIAQGMGQALMENVVYNEADGQLLSATFMDYAMPRAADMLPVTVSCYPVPTGNNPLGVKGAGEAGTIGALSAVMSAVNDVMAQRGCDRIEMPATPERVWRHLAVHSSRASGAPENRAFADGAANQ